jgi:hypothetical protein
MDRISAVATGVCCMRQSPLSLILLALALPAWAEGGCKTLEHRFDAETLKALSLEVHVGQLSVVPADDAAVHLSLEVCPRDGWFRKGKVASAELRVEQGEDRLALRVAEDRFEERWTLRVPAGVALDVEMGIGEARIEGMRGDIAVELGIGELGIEGVAADFGTVNVESGIGDATLEVPDDRAESGRALVSAHSGWSSSGKGSISAEVGIGEAEVRLR